MVERRNIGCLQASFGVFLLNASAPWPEEEQAMAAAAQDEAEYGSYTAFISKPVLSYTG